MPSSAGTLFVASRKVSGAGVEAPDCEIES
jgi:hypothetical protein